MNDLNSNNKIILDWVPPFLQKINDAKVALGIKHEHTRAPRKSTARFRYAGGEIQVIGIIMSKGDIMTHKGKGKYQERGNRISKEWFNPIAAMEIEKLADDIATNTGDVLSRHIMID